MRLRQTVNVKLPRDHNFTRVWCWPFLCKSEQFHVSPTREFFSVFPNNLLDASKKPAQNSCLLFQNHPQGIMKRKLHN